jgi:hypothetical protein
MYVLYSRNNVYFVASCHAIGIKIEKTLFYILFFPYLVLSLHEINFILHICGLSYYLYVEI